MTAFSSGFPSFSYMLGGGGWREGVRTVKKGMSFYNILT